MSNGWLVALLAEERLAPSSLRLNFLHELSLSNQPLLDEELGQCVGLRQAGY